MSFLEKIRQVWGNSRRVAEVALDEVFNHPSVGLDYDDQIRHALWVGVLAGEMKDGDPRDFVSRFNDHFLSE